MPPDKFSAVWVSHTSLTAFQHCPRSYFLAHVYKDPHTHHKIKLMSPSLALGQAVHTVLESLSTLPVGTRFKLPLVDRFHQVWQPLTGLQGGFSGPEEESRFYARGEAMLRRVQTHPGPLTNLAVKIKADLPYYWLSEADNIILCGKLDWLEYLPDQDAVHIIDFKTGKSEEESSSLQLPIYYLLATKCQARPVVKASYWYLALSDELTPKNLPADIAHQESEILEVAKKMKLARQLNRFKCPKGAAGCRYCRPFETVIQGQATLVGTNDYGQDVYITPAPAAALDSDIL